MLKQEHRSDHNISLHRRKKEEEEEEEKKTKPIRREWSVRIKTKR